ncbi:MAG: extracellular solute-binding protein [Dongiaceae bacterium]
MMVRRALALALVLGLSALTGAPAQAQESGTKVHALTLADAPKYGPDFKHLDYVNPDAPKGGNVVFEAIGTYDSFNQFITKGTPASLPGLYETLTTSPDDDILTEYGLIAESMEVAPDKSWIIFHLRPEAKWHDGQPITADDVVFSLDILKSKGDPQWRFYYGEVVKAEKLDDHTVKFSFKSGGNRELPVIMGQLPILPKHWWESRNFENVLLEAPLGSGPYKLGKFELGRSFTMERVPDYWGKDLPIRIGTSNYDSIRYDYYLDRDVSMEAFKSGALDFRQENQAKRWATAYDFPAMKDGRVKKELIPNDNPRGIQGYVLNMRRQMFQDARVRQAMILAFDFEWSNKVLFYGLYKRTRSYFQNSEMEAKGLPSPEELAILDPLKGQIPEEVFTTEYNPPATDGSGNNRENLEKAAKLLEEAGWQVVDGKRTKDGTVLSMEFLIDDPAFERISEPYAQNLRRLGIDVTLRNVDSAQYEQRLEDFDYDVISTVYGQSLSPGNEQWEFWGSAAADQHGSRNYNGIKNPAVDKLIDLIVHAESRHDLIIRCRALDRVLQWNYYMVPHWNLPAFELAWWDKFGMPDKRPDPLYGYGSDSWWIDPAKEAALKTKTAVAETGGTSVATPATNATGNATPTAEQQASTQPAAASTAAQEPADRGRSPIIYGAGAVVVFIVAYLLGRRRGKVTKE